VGAAARMARASAEASPDLESLKASIAAGKYSLSMDLNRLAICCRFQTTCSDNLVPSDPLVAW
jgi:hypothetical protein